MNYRNGKSKLLLLLSFLLVFAMAFAACEAGTDTGVGQEGAGVEEGIGEEGVVGDDGLVEEGIAEGEEAVGEGEQVAEEAVAEGEQVAEEAAAEGEQIVEEGEQVAEEAAAEGEQIVEEGEQVAEEAAAEGEQIVEEGAAGAEGAEAGEGIGEIQDVMVNAITLLDMPVDNVNDQDLGDMDDLLIDTATGNIPYAIITSGGFLGLGGESILVPFSAFVLSETGNELLLPFVEEGALGSAPTFDAANWDYTNEAWDDDAFSFWSEAGIADVDTSGLENLGATGTPIMRVSDLVGGGYSIGELGDLGAGAIAGILIDMGANRAKWIVLDYGAVGVTDVDYANNLLLVPFSAFNWENFDGQLLFSEGIDAEQLAGAPLVAREELMAGEFFDPTFDEQIVEYWEGAGFSVEE